MSWVALSHQCLALIFERFLSEESRCSKGGHTWSPYSVNQSIYCQVLNQVEQYNQHQHSLSSRRAIRVRAPTVNKPEWTGTETLSRNSDKEPWARNPWNKLHQYYTKNTIVRHLYSKSIKYIMWLQYYYSEESLMHPGMVQIMLRMLQFLKLAYLWARPHTPGAAKPGLKYLRSSCCFTHVVPNDLAITLGVLPLLAGTSLI